MAGITQNYHETIDPPAGSLGADEASVTLATTNKALLIPSKYNGLGTQFFNKVGRKLRINAQGKITTSTSPGTLTLALLFGTGADANGTSLVASAAQTLIASQSNIPWEIELYIHCRLVGTAGALFARGRAQFGTAVIAAGTFLLPGSGAAQVGSLDLSGTSIPSLQVLVSAIGGGITMVPQDYDITPMN